MPKLRFSQDGTNPDAREVPVQEWLHAAVGAGLGDWFEGVGTLENLVQVATLRGFAQVILDSTRPGVEQAADNRMVEFTRTLESLLDGWHIAPKASGENCIVFQNDKGVCFEATLVFGDTVLFQPRITEEQRMAVRSEYKFPRMQANLTRNPESVYAGMNMGFLRDMELLSTLISMWEKKGVRNR